MTMNEILKDIYTDPRNPGSLGGVDRLWKYAKDRDPSIDRDDVKEWLRTQNTYTLHKQARNRFSRNRIYVSYIDEQWECDLVDLKHLSRQNGGYKYILVVIDCFSKYLFARPIKSKHSYEILKEFKKIFKHRQPHKLRSDKGGEFDNIVFRKFCNEKEIVYFTTTNQGIKCAIVERVNRTLKNRIFRYFTLRGTRKYVDVLAKIVDSYNHSVHRSTKMAPIDVSTEDEQQVFENLYDIESLAPLVSKEPQFKVGDTVRIKYDLMSFDKKYYPLWTDIVYTVDKVYNKLTRPQYSLSLEGQRLERKYYPEELQKVTINEESVYLIEKVLAYRQRNGQKQALIKWRGYPSTFNLWIPRDQIQKL